MRYHDTVGKRRRRGRFTRWLLLIALAAVLSWAAVTWRVGSLITQGQDAMMLGDPAGAAEALDSAGFYRLRGGPVLEAQGLLALVQGELSQAETLFQEARTVGTRRTGLDLEKAGASLANQARYAEIDALAAHRTTTGGAQVPALWRAEAALGFDRLDEAQRLLDGAGAGERTTRLSELLAERKRQGRSDLFYDRSGRALFGHKLEDGTPVVEVPELGDALTGAGGLLEHLEDRDRRAHIDLTLDLAFQRAAHAALGRYAGAFVAVDPRSGAILALVNHQAEHDGGVPAYRRQFEPGSIMKMITLAAALENQIPYQDTFPLNCTGNMTLDNSVFYDWMRHGTVEDINEATAVSCNLTFAAMGLGMGQARLDDMLAAFGFDRNLDLPDLELTTGRLAQVDADRPRLGLARRAVGLENISITPAHAALLAAALANGGTMMRPHLIASRRALGASAPYDTTEPEVLLQPLSQASASVIAAAMEAVVVSADGTGRRAAMDGLPFAMKTGTAGSRDPGLNTVVFGYAPLGNPQVAFAFVAEHAGKAELEGARIVRDFLSTVRNEFEPSP